MLNECGPFNCLNTVLLICEPHNTLLLITQNILQCITQKAWKALYDYCVYNCLSGDFLNKYYFPVLVPIGVCGNMLSFLVSTFEIFASQIAQFETNVALENRYNEEVGWSYLGSLVSGKNSRKIDQNTSGPESIKWWYHQCVTHKLMTSPMSTSLDLIFILYSSSNCVGLSQHRDYLFKTLLWHHHYLLSR